MNKLIIHAENFTLFREKQSWEIGKYNFLFGELASGKSSLIKLLELFPTNDQEMKEVKYFQSFGPYANFQTILHDKSKPLGLGFEIHAPFGVVQYTYTFTADTKNTQAILSEFNIVFNNEIVFHYTTEDGQLYTTPTLNLFEAAREFILKKGKDEPISEDCPSRSELLSPILRLADDTDCIGEVEREFLRRTPALKMRKKEPNANKGIPFADFFFQLFEITDFNGLDEFAESLSWFVRQSFSSMGMFLGRNVLNTMQPYNRFTPTAFKRIEDCYKKLEEFESFSEAKKVASVLKDFSLPKLIKSELNDSEGNNYGYSYLFEYANKKRVQFYQLSSMEQKKIFLLTQIMTHQNMHREFDFHNDLGWMYIDNLENLVPLDELASFIKMLCKHFPHYQFFFETRGTHFENLTKELLQSKKIKKSDIRIFHFVKNKKNHTSHVSRHIISKRNEVYPPLFNTASTLANWKKKIPKQLHFN
jgi:hypothetical protein